MIACQKYVFPFISSSHLSFLILICLFLLLLFSYTSYSLGIFTGKGISYNHLCFFSHLVSHASCSPGPLTRGLTYTNLCFLSHLASHTSHSPDPLTVGDNPSASSLLGLPRLPQRRSSQLGCWLGSVFRLEVIIPCTELPPFSCSPRNPIPGKPGRSSHIIRLLELEAPNWNNFIVVLYEDGTTQSTALNSINVKNSKWEHCNEEVL